MDIIDGKLLLNQPVRIDEAQAAVQSTQSNGIPDTLRAARNSNDRPLATGASASSVTKSKNKLSTQLLSLLPDVPFEQTLSNLTLTELSQLALTNKDLNKRCTDYLQRKGLVTNGVLRKTLTDMVEHDKATVATQTAQRGMERGYAWHDEREFEKAQEIFDERQLWAEKLLGILENMPVKCLRGDIQKVFDLLKKPATERCLEDLKEAQLLNEEDYALVTSLSDIQKIYLLSSPALLNMMYTRPHLAALRKIPDNYFPLPPDRHNLPGGKNGLRLNEWFAEMQKGLEKATSSIGLKETASNTSQSQQLTEREEVVLNLIESGLFDAEAEPDILFGETFLTGAVNLGSKRMVAALIKFAPKMINQENDRYQRPLDIALKQGDQPMIDLLKKAGAMATPRGKKKHR